jgi:hypothetical protein
MVPTALLAIDHASSLEDRFECNPSSTGEPRELARKFRLDVARLAMRRGIRPVCDEATLSDLRAEGGGHQAILGMPDIPADSPARMAALLNDALQIVAFKRLWDLKLSIVFTDVEAELGRTIDLLVRANKHLRRLGCGLILEGTTVWEEHSFHDLEGMAFGLSSIRPAVLKLPIPEFRELDVYPTHRITEAVGAAQPWAILSAGCDFGVFENHLASSLAGGCSGFVAGSALWKDAIAIADPVERQAHLETVLTQRINILKRSVSDTFYAGGASQRESGAA